MQSIVRTVYGAHLQTCQLLELPLTIKPHSTLNEKFNIFPNEVINPQTLPRMNYVCIGNGGHRIATGVDGVAKIDVVQHIPRHAALYNHLPFVLREITNDLTAIERAKYRLRRTETHGGKTYAAYYLRLLDLSTTIPDMEYMTVIDGITHSETFNPSLSDLNPVPPALNNTGVNVTTGDYIFCSGKVPFIMTEDEVTEYLNAASVIYGDDSYAIISEIGLCSGVDKQLMGDFNGSMVAYTDTIGVQLSNFISTFYSMTFNNNGINMLLNIGSVEPMLDLVPVNN